MKEKEQLIYNIILTEVIKLEIDNYHIIFLSQMVLRKIKHPEEKMDKIASKVMKKMPKIYKRKDVIEVSSSKCLIQLEEALDKSDSVPKEWTTRGKAVKNVVKNLVQIVIAQIDEEE